MRYLIMLEQTETGFAVQVPDLAVITYGKDIESAKFSAIEAIRNNLEAYIELDKRIPDRKPMIEHIENPDFTGHLFVYVNVCEAVEKKAA